MQSKKIFFSINSYEQAIELIKITKKRIIPIIYIKYFIINGLGTNWIRELIFLLKAKFSKKDFRICVDCKNNYALFIELAEQGIDYLRVDANSETLNKLNQIAKKNKVLLNPKVSIVDLSNIKNLKKKISTILRK